MSYSKIESCGCCAGNEQALLEAVRRLTQAYQGNPNALIQVLHLAQEVFGYLPLQVQEVVADALDIPVAEVSGVVSFYSLFTSQPKGRHTINVCLGTACYVRGGKKLVEQIQQLLGIGIGETTKDRNFTFEVVRCIGACGLAPAIQIDNDVYKQVKPEHLGQILEKYV